MEVEILNWEKYNPRKDVKATSWFRLENRWWRDHQFDGKSCEIRMVWIAILSIGSELQKPRFTISPRLIAATLGIEEKTILEAIEFFQSIQSLHVHVTQTSRGRNGHVTQALRPRNATDGRTNELVVSNETTSPQPASRPLENKTTGSIPELSGPNHDPLLSTVTHSAQKAWLVAYPDAEWIRQEILKAAAWIEENPKRRPKDVRRFLGRWLSRGWEQHRKTVPTNRSGQSNARKVVPL